MPKIKTHSGTKKRCWITGSGRVRRGKAGLAHMMMGKSANRRRNLRKHGLISDTHEKMLKRLLPWG